MRREAAIALAILLFAPLALAQSTQLQALVDATPADGTLALADATYTGPATTTQPLSIRGVDQRTMLVAPAGSGPILTAERDLTIRFVRFAEGDAGLLVRANATALVGPAIFERVGIAIRLEPGATVLLRNDPTIPSAFDIAEGASLLYARPATIAATNASDGAPIVGLSADLLSPTGQTIARFGAPGARALEIDMPQSIRRVSGTEPLEEGWSVRVMADGYHGVSIPLANVSPGSVQLAMRPLLEGEPAAETKPTGSTASEVVSAPPSDPFTGSSDALATELPEESTSLDEPLTQASIVEAPAPPAISTPPVQAVLVAASLAAASAAIGGALLLRSERRLWKLLAFLAPLYTRLKKRDLLDNPARERILAQIAAHPGIRYRELQRALAMPNGALSHHLQILLREQLVAEAREGHAVRFHIPGERPGAPVDTTERVLAYVRANPGATGTSVARALDLSASLAGYHLQKLAQDGRIRRGREGVRLRAYAAKE